MNESFERDPMIDKVRDALRSSPAAAPDARAVAKILTTVWASPRPSAWQRFMDAFREAFTLPRLTRVGVGAIAAVALVVGYTARGAFSTAEPESQVAAATDPTFVPVAYDASMVPTQFVLENADAKEISLVGDFNDWKVGEHKLVKLPNGLWTATVPLPPGRHVYAYMLDGTILMADPRAPKAGDADYGREGSVVMVFAK